jgi:hypothetical protein
MFLALASCSSRYLVWSALALLASAGACSGSQFSSSNDDSPGANRAGEAASGAATQGGKSFGAGGEGGSLTGSAGDHSDPPGAGGTGTSGTGTGGKGMEECSPSEPPRCGDDASLEVCGPEGDWQLVPCETSEHACAPAVCVEGECLSMDVSVADALGDCRQPICSFGEVLSVPALDDVPQPRGICDVPACSEQGEPIFGSDNEKCAANQGCVMGNCVCSGCPNGVVAALSATDCRMPASLVATANKTGMQSAASRAVDGNGVTTWNSGTYDGILTLHFAVPQPLVALTIHLAGAADGTGSAKVIEVEATLEGGANSIVKSAVFDYTASASGRVRLAYGLVEATKVTLKFDSPSSWIAVKEVLFEICE